MGIYGIGSNQYKKRPGTGSKIEPSATLTQSIAEQAKAERWHDSQLGFDWDRPTLRWDAISPKGVERALVRYRHRFVDFVYDASYLEGNTFTLPEVQTLLDGVTVGGKKLSEERQVLSLRDSVQLLRNMVETGTFEVSKECSDRLHYEIAQFEALEPGAFRGEGQVTGGGTVNLGDGRSYSTPTTEPGGENLKILFDTGWAEIRSRCAHAVEQAAAYFALAAHSQFYFDGNKRTGRSVMNGHLMSNGFDAISVPASRALDFNEALRSLYADADAGEVIELLYEIYRESEGF